MLIKVWDDSQIEVKGARSFRSPQSAEARSTDVHIFDSPCHFPTPLLEPSEFTTDIRSLTDMFSNDTVCVIDRERSRFTLARDWPGNVQVFYWHQKTPQGVRLVVAHKLGDVVQQLPEPRICRNGVDLFLLDRKYHHTPTIYEGVFVLRPGSKLDLDLKTGQLNVDAWYRPFATIDIAHEDMAIENYRLAIDDSIRRTVDRKLPVALMFSGGSDSTFLLERLEKLGYENISLFNIKVLGEVTESRTAASSAQFYGRKIHTIEVDKNLILEDWLQLFRRCYHYLSDMRIDGMFSPAIQVFRKMDEFYEGNAANIVWGSQYAIASPRVSNSGIARVGIAFFLAKLGKLSLKRPLGWREKFYLACFRAHGLDPAWIDPAQLAAHQDLYLRSGNEASRIDELVNLTLSINYNHLKHWWMHWREVVRSEFFPAARNAYPFHDRRFQEATMRFSLPVRVGGWWNLLKMPKTYKRFFMKCFERPIPPAYVLGNNKKALPSYFSLFRNQTFYQRIMGILRAPENAELVAYLERSIDLKLPTTYEEFAALDYVAVERFSGIVIMLTRFEVDGVNFESRKETEKLARAS